MNVKKVCSGDAVASSLGAVQGESWLCARMPARLYLAIPPPQWSLPLRRAARPGFAFVRTVSMCHVHLHYDAVSTFLQASKICASSPVLRSVIHSWSVFIHRFFHDSPTPLLNNPLPRGYAWNAYFSRFTCPLLRNVFKIAKQRNRFCPAE